MDLGNKVKLRREQLGMSQEELAFKMGYKSRTSINKIENGRPVSQKIIVRLAEVLQVSVHYLMGWDEEEKEKPAAETGSELSEKDREIIDRVMRLSDSQKAALAVFLQSLEGK